MNTKKIHVGNLTAESGKVYEFEEVTGSIYAKGADTRTTFPKLASVGRSIYARGADTRTAFPKLASVGGSIDAGGADTRTTFPKLASVGGYIDVDGADTRTTFPKLASVGGYIYARGADTRTAFPKLASVGGSIDAGGADTRTTFPKLASVGGSIDAGGNYSHIKTNYPQAAAICADALSKSFLAAGYIFADGILAKIISKRGSVYKVIICGKREKSFVIASGDGNYSHGATIKEARDSLIYKLQSRDLTEFERWTLKTCVSLADAIKAYRSITGACEAGVRGFCEQQGKIPAKLTIAEIVEMTKGKYGSEQFAKFFEGKQ